MKKFVYGLLAFSPVLALAQTGTGTVGLLTTLVGTLRTFVNALIPLVIAIAVLYFFWGLVTYLRAAGDPKMQDQGKSHMIWGIIAIAVMVSIFGLVNWLQNTLGVTGGTITPPQI